MTFVTITSIVFWLSFIILIGCLVISILEKRNLQKQAKSYNDEINDLLQQIDDNIEERKNKKE